MSRPRVLLLAEMANPDWVSVPLIGWMNALALQEVADVHLVTQIRNQRAIEARGWVQGQDFTAIDSEAVAKPFWQLGALLGAKDGKGWTASTAVSTFSYYYFEHLVWKRFAQRLRSGEFDVVHRVTPVTPTAPSILARRCQKIGIPMVLGPLNGGVAWPQEFQPERLKEREWLSYVRQVYRYLPGYTSTLESASRILVGSRATQQEIPARFQSKCEYLPENAINPQLFAAPVHRQPYAGRPLVACFVGRLVPYKGLDMAIRAAAPFLVTGQMRLEVVGDGPEMAEMQKFVHELGLNDSVSFAGWQTQPATAAILQQSDVLLFPSIREFGGGVVLEAMAAGVVPIVVDYAGPGELVEPAWGYKVALQERSQIIAALTAVLAAIVTSDGQDLQQRSQQALRVVHERFTWRAKAERYLSIYDAVMGVSSSSDA